MQEVYPPIPERTTDQLIEMIETSHRWRDDVLKAASQELEKRGVPFEEQATKYKRRKKRDTAYKRRASKVKAKATYSTTEKVLIVLIGSFLMLLLQDFTLFHSGRGYKQKNRQGWFYLILGFC